jgi:periplasmic protein TonB
VQTWVFNPGLRNGQPVQGWVLVPISFKLSDA